MLPFFPLLFKDILNEQTEFLALNINLGGREGEFTILGSFLHSVTAILRVSEFSNFCCTFESFGN